MNYLSHGVFRRLPKCSYLPTLGFTLTSNFDMQCDCSLEGWWEGFERRLVNLTRHVYSMVVMGQMTQNLQHLA